MSMYSNRLQPALQNLLQRVVQFFHPSTSSTMTHISADVQRTLNASCMTISGERTKQLYIFCHVTGFTSDFLSFSLVWNLFGSFTEPFNCNLFSLRCVSLWNSTMFGYWLYIAGTFRKWLGTCRSRWRGSQKQISSANGSQQGACLWI